MSVTKIVNFRFLEFNYNTVALMYGIEEYNRSKQLQAVILHSRYWHDFQHQPRRNPYMSPLLHNGKKYRK